MDQQSKREHWATILEQQRQSELSIKQFCTEQNLNYQTFHYWSKKLTQLEPETKVLHTQIWRQRMSDKHPFMHFEDIRDYRQKGKIEHKLTGSTHVINAVNLQFSG